MWEPKNPVVFPSKPTFLGGFLGGFLGAPFQSKPPQPGAPKVADSGGQDLRKVADRLETWTEKRRSLLQETAKLGEWVKSTLRRLATLLKSRDI